METLVITDCASLSKAYKHHSSLDFNDFSNDSFDILRSFIKFIRKNNINLVLAPKDVDENKDVFINFLKAIADTKGSRQIQKNHEIHELIESKKDIDKQLTDEKVIIYKDKEDDYLDNYSSRFQKLCFNFNRIIEVWKKLSSFDTENPPRHFLIDQKSEFNWEKISAFKNPSSYILIEDPYLGTMRKEDVASNVIPIIKALLPDRHKKSRPTHIIIVFSKNKAQRANTNLEKMLSDYEELLKDEKQIRISLYPFSDRKLHDRHIYTENVIIQPSSSLDFMSGKGAVISDLYKSYSVDIYGIGCGSKFENLDHKFKELKKEILTLNQRKEYFGDAAFK